MYSFVLLYLFFNTTTHIYYSLPTHNYEDSPDTTLLHHGIPPESPLASPHTQ